MNDKDANLTNVEDLEAHLWLEEVEGEDALEWVREQNDRTLDALQANPRYAGFEEAALDVLTGDDRIPYGTIRNGLVYNFWQDAEHVRGLWRRTPLDSYRTDDPTWEVLLDVDALAESEDANWVFKGANVFRAHGADEYQCLVSLSDGGKDAVIQREFDIATKTFVADGFVTPEAKQGASWVDPDTVLIATDWGDEEGPDGTTPTVTDSGYPFVVRRWSRGTLLADAVEVMRGEQSNVGVFPFTIETEAGDIISGAVQADTFFTSSYWVFDSNHSGDGGGAVQLPIPAKSSPNEMSHERLLLSLEENWQPGDTGFLTGDLVSFDLLSFLETGVLGPVDLVFRPTETQAVSGVAVAANGTLLSITDNVVGQVLRLERTDSGWETSPVELPGSGDVGIAFADRKEATVMLNYEDFLTPASLLALDTTNDTISTLKTAPSRFNTDGLIVEQHHATSSDGTAIPHFIVRRADAPMDGSTPTLLYGYGGFQVPLNPSYSGNIGRNWLEQGGAFVLANIRGGGEFGPAWHQAGLKTNRQRIYDDFIAVAESLIKSKLTSSQHLGIMGGSNGGLLMGVMLNQRPDLWNAVVVQVPLLDMLRYHLLLAGASWVDEYGSPDDADERAFLETISPYHNFDPSLPYPMPFFVTSTKDDRVHPGHARKMAKRFEEADRAFWYYENIDGGHSAAANQTEAAKRNALEFTYLTEQLF